MTIGFIRHKAKIASNFGRAATQYDAYSAIQRLSAAHLTNTIMQIPLAAQARVLEIGCGTGHLTQALQAKLSYATWIASDLSTDMVQVCKQRFQHQNNIQDTMQFTVMDGEAPLLSGPFDLICANLAVQWFHDLSGSLHRLAALLAPGGVLAVSTLGCNSLKEWRTAHDELGLLAATPDFLDLAAFRQAWSVRDTRSGKLKIDEEYLFDDYPNALSFVRALKAIGADTPVRNHVPLSPGSLRRVLRHIDQTQGEVFRVSYQVMYGVLLCT